MAFWTYWSKPWLKRNFGRNTLFYMKVGYIINHLDPHDRKKITGLVHFIEEELWQSKKEKSIIEQLDAGKDPLSFDPMRLVLHKFREEFRVDDGIPRLGAFRKKGIKNIRVKLRNGGW